MTAGSSFYATAVVVVFFLAAKASTHMLTCYSCSSIDNVSKYFPDQLRDKCWNPNKNNVTVIECPHALACYKEVIELYSMVRVNPIDGVDSGNVMKLRSKVVSRYCGAANGYTDDCTVVKGSLSVTTTCSCTGDECNVSYSSIRSTTATILALLSVAIAKLFA